MFGICGGDYTVVCKNLNYTFLRPCYGPAVYRMKSRENIRELVASGTEFNITLDLDVLQQAARIGEKGQACRPLRRDVPRHAEGSSQDESQA